MSYVETNGLSLYYDEHGTGDPFVLLHGGLSSGDMFAALTPVLAADRRVVLVDLQGHGRTADVDRPFDPETMADDVAGLIEHLGGTADVLGYSLGGEVALRLAIQHPERVRNLTLVSIPFQRSGNHPEVLAAMDQMTPELAEMLKGSPVHELYSRIAPRPEDFATMVAKTSEALKVDFDWTAEVAELTNRTLLVFADADSVRPAHISEFFGLLGGGLRDAGWDGSDQPSNRLAVLPGTSHYNVLESPLLAPAVLGFLQSSVPQ
jgi:pimeloyl-ACP methyl ester carboxylesterase